MGIGYYSDLANATGALQIWVEHRYYADELPFYPDDNFDHFTIEQSLVDHIELVLFIQSVTGLTRSPVVALGSSYSKQHGCGDSCLQVHHVVKSCQVSHDHA